MQAPPRNQDEPRYLVIKRSDRRYSAEVSPFVIKQEIDRLCEGQVEMCRKTKGGTLLVRTKSKWQAQKLLAVRTFHGLPICVSEHRTLNFAKGVIYCQGLSRIGVGVILRELKSQKVVRVRKLLNKRLGEPSSSGLILLTFASVNLPSTLSIGYDTVAVRPFIPLPLQCRKYLRLEHPTATCSKPKACHRCSAIEHTVPGEACTADRFCINCMYDSNEELPHSQLQQAIIAIKTIEKIDYKSALRIYNFRQVAND